MKIQSSFNFFLLLSIISLYYQCTPAKAPETSTVKEMVFPTDAWSVRSPESQDVDPQKLQIALDTLKSFCKEDALHETILIRNGHIIWQGDSIHKVHNVWSSSKSFTSTVLGLLVQQGKCQVTDLAYQWEPALDRDPYNKIQLKHFTTMTSGYNAQGDTRWNEVSKDWSWTPYVPGEPIFEAGQNYCYWDEAQMMFGRVLTRIAGKQLKDVFQENIGSVIGFGDFEWGPEGELDGIPINNGCTNVMINAQQLARFGLLYLNKGNWNGTQLLEEAWVDAATQAQVPLTTKTADTDRGHVKGSGGYGYNWWVNGGDNAMPDSPKLYYSSGLNNNMCFVIPDWNMVVVRMGVDGNPEEPKHVAYNRFFRELGKAVSL